MQNRVARLFKSLEIPLLGLLGLFAAATAIALRHAIETPQPLESRLPGEAHIYRWKQGHIFYKTLGAAESPPLLFLHTLAIGSSADEMCALMRPLAEHYRVYAPDLLGFGLSDRPPIAYTAETYLALCRDFLTEVVGQPTTLLASGLSCNYAVALAARLPDRCERLALLSPTELFTPASPATTLRKLVQTPLIGWLLYPLVSTRQALRRSITRPAGTRQAVISRPKLEHLYATTHQFGAQYAALALLAGKLAYDASQQFEKLSQPALIIWETSALLKASQVISRYHVSAHTQVALIQDTGTDAHKELSEKVVTSVLEWSAESRSKPAIEAYCIKCKQKRALQDVQAVTMKNGRPALQGVCSVCGTRLYRIGRQ